MEKRQVVVIVHNVRSAHNVGAILRTADGLGMSKVYLSGYTPYPITQNDQRLPHIAKSAHHKIAKTALGAEKNPMWEQIHDLSDLMDRLYQKGFVLAALEQNPNSQSLETFKYPDKIALILGNEINGVDKKILEKCEIILEIPMFGKKESYNVVEAASMAMYHCKFF